MSNGLKKHGLFWSAIILLVIAALLAIRGEIGGQSKLKVIRPVPSFSLTDMDGKLVQSSDLGGSVVLLAFIFTMCPDICPITTSKMVQLQEELKNRGQFGKQVRFVSITIDPEHDTPEVLKQYASKMGADAAGWSFVRGTEQGIQQLASRFGYMVQNLGDGNFVHTVTSLTLIDSRGQVRNVYKMGEDMDNQTVLNDIETLASDLKKTPASAS
ncbi:SCO family protein [Paenibacillus sp. MWE-103]|uniref:SCO family protein n=1 Tax=Paenibacillus artemisiicola TaxID=1172618 RepID=A0ABS3W7T2_9BACL|nr:SCO family protein [Paenibacillus artemisiicola]MBO7744236.1 SCO family protein [Paenibacillus artemisiicola]